MENVIYIIALAIVELAGIAGGIVYFFKAQKAKANAKTETEAAKADAEAANAKLAIKAEAIRLITRNEYNLADLHAMLKEREGTASGQRFENTMNALKIFCLANKLPFTTEELENEVVEAVEFTKKVNYDEKKMTGTK